MKREKKKEFLDKIKREKMEEKVTNYIYIQTLHEIMNKK